MTYETLLTLEYSPEGISGPLWASSVKDFSGGVESRHAVPIDDVASQNECGFSVSGADRKATSGSNAPSAEST